MKGIFFIGVAFVFMSALCYSSAAYVLDDNYDSAISVAAGTAGSQAKADRLRSLLKESMRPWGKKSSFRAVREQVSSLSGIDRQFRLEIGNINTGAYEVVWAAETRREVIIFSNALSFRQLLRGKIGRQHWDRIVQEFSRLKGDIRCGSALGVSDGSSYFGTFAEGSNSKKFAFYGAITYPRLTTSSQAYSQSKPCSEIVLTAYDMVKSANLVESVARH